MFEWLRRLWCSFGIQHWPIALSEYQEAGDVNKILEGLEDALQYARCAHDMIVQSVTDLGDGRKSVTSRCDRCGGRETKLYPQAAIEIFEVSRP